MIPEALLLDLLYLLPSDSWGKLLGAIWCNAVWCYLGYGAAAIIEHRKALKELKALEIRMDAEMDLLVRRTDFQLRAKGCDGLLTEEERVK